MKPSLWGAWLAQLVEGVTHSQGREFELHVRHLRDYLKINNLLKKKTLAFILT